MVKVIGCSGFYQMSLNFEWFVVGDKKVGYLQQVANIAYNLGCFLHTVTVTTRKLTFFKIGDLKLNLQLPLFSWEGLYINVFSAFFGEGGRKSCSLPQKTRH